ncbi:MAG: type III-B CRISPR module RAMP protein Cmr6 [Candidatus Methanomethyliaceae archaeon]
MKNKQYYLPGKDFPLPEDPSHEDFIDQLVNNKKLRNIKLWLERFPKFSDTKFDLRRQINMINEDRLSIPQKYFPITEYKCYLDRLELMMNELQCNGFSKSVYESKVAWRLVVNLGSESVYETSIILHRNYSIPIIPGSAVKGVARIYAERTKNPLKDEIFGNQESSGKVIFFDALPIIESEKDFLVLDIMNVHYPDYYQNEKEPGDWMNPNPIFFLAVEGLKYRFTVASKDRKLVENALELLKIALREIGIGAKTSAGYGYFEEIKNERDRVQNK